MQAFQQQRDGANVDTQTLFLTEDIYIGIWSLVGRLIAPPPPQAKLTLHKLKGLSFGLCRAEKQTQIVFTIARCGSPVSSNICRVFTSKVLNN